MMPGAGGDLNTTLPLILSIVAMVFCCASGFFLPIVALVFSLQADKLAKTGDTEGARAKIKTVYTLLIVSVVLSVISQAGLMMFSYL